MSQPKNPQYTHQVNEKIENLKTSIEYPIECRRWVSMIIVVPNKNGKSEYMLNFEEKDAYNFISWFSGYNQTSSLVRPLIKKCNLG